MAGDSTPMTPMLFQYVVGLCCLRRNPDAVDIVIGDQVFDVAARIDRDVDVTVTLQEADGSLRAFKGFEVKREAAPLDVTDVEQLCAKFADMPKVTHRAIVSASGYAKAAIAKAKSHNVTLFGRHDWTRPVSEMIPHVKVGPPAEAFRFGAMVLDWLEPELVLHVRQGPQVFRWDAGTPLFGEDGRPHSKFPTMRPYLAEIVSRSSNALARLDGTRSHADQELLTAVDETSAIDTVPWAHTHLMLVGKDDAYIFLNGSFVKVEGVTIKGRLYWQIRGRPPQFFILQDVTTGEIFTGTAIAEGAREGTFTGVVLAPGSTEMDVHQIALGERHKNAIRKLSLLRAASAPAVVPAGPGDKVEPAA